MGVVLTDSRIEWDRRGIRVAHVCRALQSSSWCASWWW